MSTNSNLARLLWDSFERSTKYFLSNSLGHDYAVMLRSQVDVSRLALKPRTTAR